LGWVLDMSFGKIFALSAVLSLCATASNADVTAIPRVSDEVPVDTIMASLPVAPSIVFFVCGILGLAFLARRKARKTTQTF